MISTGFILALITLLAVPGPTNALLLATGVAGNFRAMVLAPLCALGGYMVAVLLLGCVLGPVVTEFPAASLALRLAAATYLIASALRLWRASPSSGLITLVPVQAVFLTTLLNPKAIIVALVLMPQGWQASIAQALPPLAVLGGLTLLISGSWVGLGSLLRRSLARFGGERTTNRLTAVVLGAFGLSLMVAGLAR